MIRTTTRREFLRILGLSACALLATSATTTNAKPPSPTAGRALPPDDAPVTVDGWLLRESDR